MFLSEQLAEPIGMADNMLNREEAYQLLTEYTTSDSLIKHALAVEALMQAYARKNLAKMKIPRDRGLIARF